MSKRCTLCGGKIVNNVCVECGLDNSKNDENYSPGKSSCEGKPMTHVHTGKENTYTVQKVRKKKSTGSKALGVISILIIIMLVFSSAVPYIIDRVKEESYTEQVSEEMEMEAYDPYELVERELSGDGEEYETILTAGLYKGGVHLPEGRYSILIESGNGTFSVSDTENNIFLSVLFNDGDMRCV